MAKGKQMIDLLELQKKTYDNALRLGYKMDKMVIVNKVFDELDEFIIAKPSPDVMQIKAISNIKDPAEFVKAYELHLKDREGCEISDIIKVLLSYSESVDTDSEMNLVLKNRYNNYRVKSV